ncbi:hypothetical protein FJT64_010238 [Amphibalanus amphitrite]|uniref:RRM domain-containing protein n=1 Tax=Amphibalanus amphitrite TaxID=1232801 RepID=A0A6A4V5Z8_AMPAM|nr:hypothetical protein FJT64_010238 [Amphibalanus amphitrite]
MEDELQAGEDGFYCVGFKNVFALNESQIMSTFSQYGNVQSVRGAKDGIDNRRWTFVRFCNPEEAVRAITGMRASPHLCNVNYVKYVADARPKSERLQTGGTTRPAAGSGVSPMVRGDQPAVPERSPARPPAAGASGKYEVYVGNWPLSLEEDDLYGLFAKFNIKALSVRLYKKEERGFAFVVVPSAEDVTRAIEQLNRGKVAGRQIVRLGGSVHRSGERAPPDAAQMPPLVLPPPEQPAMPPRPAAYRPPVGANGAAPPAQYNGTAGRPPRPDIRFDREPAGYDRSPARYDRDPARYDRDPARYDREPPVDHFESEFEPPRPRAGPYGGPPRPAPTRSAQPGPPPLAGLGSRRSYNQRADAEVDYSEPFVKRARYGEPEPAGPMRTPSAPPPLACPVGPSPRISMQPQRGGDMGPPPMALRSAVAISERIKSRLHAPMDVVAANFPAGTNEHDLMQLFDRFEPLNVRIMVNNSSPHPDDFTYAYVTLSSRMMADEAVMEMDGMAFHGRPLVVETRKN